MKRTNYKANSGIIESWKLITVNMLAISDPPLICYLVTWAVEMPYPFPHPVLPAEGGRAGPELMSWSQQLQHFTWESRLPEPCLGKRVELVLVVWVPKSGP